jgi:hypothetical protein
MRWKTYCRLEERDRRLIAAWCGGVGETIDRLRSQGAKPSRIAQRSHAAGLAAGRAFELPPHLPELVGSGEKSLHAGLPTFALSLGLADPLVPSLPADRRARADTAAVCCR